jgi:hypothetical protein
MNGNDMLLAVQSGMYYLYLPGKDDIHVVEGVFLEKDCLVPGIVPLHENMLKVRKILI